MIWLYWSSILLLITVSAFNLLVEILGNLISSFDLSMHFDSQLYTNPDNIHTVLWNESRPDSLLWPMRWPWKSQEETLGKTVGGIGPKETAGLTFVSLLRVRHISYLAVLPFYYQRTFKISTLLLTRMVEERRLNILYYVASSMVWKSPRINRFAFATVLLSRKFAFHVRLSLPEYCIYCLFM
jgi:hypothetical protein